MTDSNDVGNVGIAPLRNVAALATLVRRVNDRQMGLPGMACFYGPSGYGKSQAAIWAHIKHQAVLVQMKSTWTKKKLCEVILKEMSIVPDNTVADMVDQISEALVRTGATMLIDEADFLVQRRMIEIVRDIYESSQAPVILIGEELLPQKLRQWERVHGRMMDWVAADPGAEADARVLAGFYAKGITISDDLIRKIARESAGSIRRICVNIAQVAQLAQREGLDAVGMAEWGAREFFTGEAPVGRNFAVARRA